MIPNGTPSRLEASWATACPTLVILNAVFLMVSHSTSKLLPRTFSSAYFTTPGPLTPTLITASASVTPWKAPAMNGLSSGALHRTTSFAQPSEPLSLVLSAVSLTILPIMRTASMFIPVLVDPTFTELHTVPVQARASGMDFIIIRSLSVIPLDTIAEKPPRKFTPISDAVLSKVMAIFT